MKLSIVTLTYNNLSELKKTLESIPPEDYIESIVINGGNCAETVEYLKDCRGIVVTGKDKGIADAFNKGVKCSTGDAIMFLNSGDILWSKSYPLKALNILEKNSNIFFVHSSIIFDDQYGGELIIYPRRKNLGRDIPYLHPTMIVRKVVFEQLGGFNTKYEIGMDFDFIVRMEKKGYRGFYFDSSPVVKMEGTGKSQTKEFKAIMECFNSLRENHSLSFKNIVGIKVRFILFLLRRLALCTGGKRLMKILKQKKYRKNS
jgi:GT2 family glycosyltransferase